MEQFANTNEKKHAISGSWSSKTFILSYNVGGFHLYHSRFCEVLTKKQKKYQPYMVIHV